MLGFAATLGFTVGAFQGLLGQAGLKPTLPVIVYLFVVAVGTDYSILMTARLREEALGGRAPREATALGVEHAGPAVAAAGLILAGTFTSLLLTGIASLMQIGFAVSSGILIAALVMATLLVPSLTALLGHAAWWPGHRRAAPGHRRTRSPRSTSPSDGCLDASAPTPGDERVRGGAHADPGGPVRWFTTSHNTKEAGDGAAHSAGCPRGSRRGPHNQA